MVMGDMEMKVELAVVGAGPAGLGAAFRAASLGIDTVLVDMFDNPGGHFLHTRTVPRQFAAQLASPLAEWSRLAELGISISQPSIDLARFHRTMKDHITRAGAELAEACRKRNILYVTGRAVFDSANTLRVEHGEINRIKFDNCVLATGRTCSLPTAINESNRVISADQWLELRNLPENLLISGNTADCIELAIWYSTLGSRVHLVTAQEEMIEGADKDLAQVFTDKMREHLTLDSGTTVESVEESAHSLHVQLMRRGETQVREYSQVIQESSLTPATTGIGLENTGLQAESDGSLYTNDRQQSSINTIYAAGTVTGHHSPSGLALREGIVAAEVIAGLNSALDIRALPFTIGNGFQIGWCGLTEQQALEEGITIQVRHIVPDASTLLFSTTDLQRLKMVCEPDTGRILGFGGTGSCLEPLLAEACLAIETGCLAEDLALTLHPMPSRAGLLPELASLFTPFSFLNPSVNTGN